MSYVSPINLNPSHTPHPWVGVVDLLETFSKIDTKINFEKAQKILDKNKKTPIRLNKSIPVDIIYLTTWVDFDGTIEFRDDLYGYDKMQLEHTIKR